MKERIVITVFIVSYFIIIQIQLFVSICIHLRDFFSFVEQDHKLRWVIIKFSTTSFSWFLQLINSILVKQFGEFYARTFSFQSISCSKIHFNDSNQTILNATTIILNNILLNHLSPLIVLSYSLYFNHTLNTYQTISESIQATFRKIYDEIYFMQMLFFCWKTKKKQNKE